MTGKSLAIFQIDAFIIKEKLFSGNPASIIVLDYDDDIDDEIKQNIAAEMNQSMTAFVSKAWSKNNNNNDDCDINNNVDNNGSNYKIRYFTAIQEFPLCGHATVAASLLLSKTLPFMADSDCKKLVYETKFGEILTVMVDRNELITISMPTYIPNMININEVWLKNIVELGLNIDYRCVEEVSLTELFLLIRLSDLTDNRVSQVVPNYEIIKNIDRKGVKNAIIVTQKANTDFNRTIVVTQKANFDQTNCHFYSRVFAPWIGVDEDPVCGSAHALLTPFWKQRLGFNGPLIANQCSYRGGVVRCVVNKHRIELSGNARKLFEGKLYL